MKKAYEKPTLEKRQALRHGIRGAGFRLFVLSGNPTSRKTRS
jgi:hypothetical protein